MGNIHPTVIETGTFASPTTKSDAPYELVQHPTGELVVTCLTTGTAHDVSVLAEPTNADIESQRRAFMREIAAWLSANGPANPPREQLAVEEVGRALNAVYTAQDLADDREWIKTNDLSKRVNLLKKGLVEPSRLQLVEFAAQIAAAGSGVSETDAQFIEILGVGLGLQRDVVNNTVVTTIQSLAAA